VVEFDAVRRQTQFEEFCSCCGLYRVVVTATPAYLKSEPTTDFSRSDILFASGNAQHPLIFVSQKAKEIIKRERLSGAQFEATLE
jgi:hypothetical protein